VEELLATGVTVHVIPVGGDAIVVPAEFVYQEIVPIVPVKILAVVTAKLALPAVPAVIVPICDPRLTVIGGANVNVAIEETTEP
jgi:hypothetical protein